VRRQTTLASRKVSGTGCARLSAPVGAVNFFTMTRNVKAGALQSPALLSIDLQNDFVLPGAACVAGTIECIPQVRLLVDAFRQLHLPIVHVIRLYETDGSNAEPCRRQFIRDHSPLVAPCSPGARLVNELCPPELHEVEAESLYVKGMEKIVGNE
jgi:isochorismate hydrolase